MNDSHLTIAGNVTADPILREGQSGPYVTFRVASTPRRFDRSRGWVDGDTTFVSVIAFNSLAVHIAESVHRGQPVLVLGRVRLNTWSDGPRQVTSLELQASAVGHNLVFGRSSFVKGSAAAQETGDRMADPAVTTDLRRLSVDQPRDGELEADHGEPEADHGEAIAADDPWADPDGQASTGLGGPAGEIAAEPDVDRDDEPGSQAVPSPWAPFGNDPETDLYVQRRAG